MKAQIEQNAKLIEDNYNFEKICEKNALKITSLKQKLAMFENLQKNHENLQKELIMEQLATEEAKRELTAIKEELKVLIENNKDLGHELQTCDNLKKSLFEETCLRISGKKIEADSWYKLILDLKKEKHRLTLSELVKAPFPTLHTISITLCSTQDHESYASIKELTNNCFPRNLKNFYLKGNSIETEELKDETKEDVIKAKDKVSQWLGIWSFGIGESQFSEIFQAHSKCKTIQFYECKSS